MHIAVGTSPEEAIKAAYDFAKVLRDGGMGEDDFSEQCTVWVDHRYTTNALLPYIRAGFEAGFFGKALPWVRQVHAAAPHAVDVTRKATGRAWGPSSPSE